ncbi:MAG: Crp/Fnr family transcriptional regulator [Bacillota bacterium]|nr:Crp/Fnr family transcriptional regulator [Bacillota bacterium]
MKEYFDNLLTYELFCGLIKSELEQFLTCMSCRTVGYKKGETILLAGNPVSEFGLILSGEIEASQEDFSGDRVIINHLCAPEMFAEVLACSSGRKSPVTITALSKTDVLYLNYSRLSSCCKNGCAAHNRIIQNMLKIIADKYFALNDRIGYLIKKSVRSKLSYYLLNESEISGSDTFSAALSKTSLSFFINADRSAMSRELSRMRAEGLIDYDRKSYTLKKPGLLKEMI